MRIDHIYICTQFKAPEAEKLKEFGLIEGSSNTHPGQGTSNKRFFFENFMLELLWVDNLEEVQSELTKPMRLFERCMLTSNRISPFGICLRPASEEDEILSFPVWDYRPNWLPDFLKIQVADNTPLSEPMYFYMSFGNIRKVVEPRKREPEPIEHKVSLRELTSVKVYVNQDVPLSEAAQSLNQHKILSVVNGNEHLLELEFDNGASNQERDFRPDLPLVLKW